MSILQTLAEPQEWYDTPPGIDSSDTNHFRSAYVRCSYKWSTSSTGVITRGLPFPGGAITSAWFSFYIYNVLAVGTSYRLVGLGNHASGGKGIYLSSVNQKIVLLKWDGSSNTVLATESGNSIVSNHLDKWDIQISSYGASATVNIYKNGGTNPILTYSGDISISGVAGLDCICMSGVIFDGYLSEMIVADEDTRTFSLATLVPNAAGDTLEWTGAYTAIDEITSDDTDLAYTDTADQDAQYNLSATPTGTFAVKGLNIVARASKSNDASIGTLELGLKSGGTVDMGSGNSLTTGWGTYQRLMSTVNGSIPSTAALDTSQLDLQSET